MEHKARVTISRTGYGEISLHIVDDYSRTEVVRLSMSAEAFGEAVTGLSRQLAKASYVKPEHADRLGKMRVVEQRSIVYTGPAEKKYDKEYLSDWLLLHAREEGWIVDPYLGSQSSVTHKGLHDISLNYRVYKFVDALEGE